MEVLLRSKKGVISKILDSINNVEAYEIKVPADILQRSLLLCRYIEDETKTRFQLSQLLILLYKNYILYSVKTPLPNRILEESTRKKTIKKPQEYIKMVCNGVESWEKVVDSEKSIYREESVYIKMDKGEAEKGKIILNELYFTKGVYITMEELLANLWINFITDYRDGTNKRIYSSIVKILKALDINYCKENK